MSSISRGNSVKHQLGLDSVLDNVLEHRACQRQPARIFEGRLVKYVPAPQLGHNIGTFAIAVIGYFDGEDPVYRNTRYAIEMLLTRRPDKSGAGEVRTLGGHRDVVATECPGDTLYAQLDRICAATNLARYV